MNATPPPTPVSPPPGVRNDFLDRLHEIVPPEPVAWTPQTAGWYILGTVAVAILLWTVWRMWRRWSAGRFRRQALAELTVIERQLGTAEERQTALRHLPDLLKRAALAARPRAEVAALYGPAWLEFLDAGVGSAEFTGGAGRLLTDIAYLPQERLVAIDEQQVRSLVALARRWIDKGTRSH